jgi:single-strand DNA-binding protein
MADLNNVSFTGHLTRDAEQKTVSTGTQLVVFDIANNTGWGDYKKTLFLTVNIWGKTGTNIYPYLKKGTLVAVSGALEVQEWTSNIDGEKKTKNCINCRDCILLSSKKNDDDGGVSRYDPPEIPF